MAVDDPIETPADAEEVVSTVAALDSIAANLASLASAMHDLVLVATGDMQAQVKRQGNRTRFGMVVISLLVGAVLWVSLSNQSLLHERSRTGDQIADCTNPGGECYQRSQEQLATALAKLTADNDARAQKAIERAVCAVRPDLCVDGVPKPGVIPG